jgi:hypothetical protein
MTAGPCVSLAKITTIPEKTSSATPLGGPRRSLTSLADGDATATTDTARRARTASENVGYF